MARLESGKDGVKVYSDSRVFLGTARGHGKPLSSRKALAQLGYQEDEAGELKALNGAARLAVLEAE